MQHATTLLLLSLLLPAARAQQSGATFVVLPQVSAFSSGQAHGVRITDIRADVDIVHQVAVTTLEIGLNNADAVRREGVLLLPVPEGSLVRSFDFEGIGAEPSAKLLPRDEARSTYDSIVFEARDPALLEFAGYRSIRSSVFPIEARGAQRIRITYEQILAADGERLDYLLPRSESLASTWVPWKISVRIRSEAPIATVYSPSHRLVEERVSPREVRLELDAPGALEPGPYRLSWLLEGSGLSASIYAYPDARAGGGYFLLLAAVPVSARAEKRQLREVTLVLDTSGSMAGEKFAQALEAARQIVEGLGEGELFNLIDYAEDVHAFAPRPLVKSPAQTAAARRYLDLLRPTGPTNLHGGLCEALRQEPHAGTLPLVLLLTDGIPTAGITEESRLLADALALNAHGRRIFTFGVGDDVNAPLLDHLASQSRADSTYVAIGEDVEQEVGRVYARLQGPVLAGPELVVLDANGERSTTLVRELAPARLPDCYEGDQLVVLGKYTRDEPLTFEVSGDYFGERRTFRFSFDLSAATTTNDFVPRLWASRRIGTLIDEVRLSGADLQAPDPAMQERASQILALSSEYGILTEYTAFLALEGSDLSQTAELREQLEWNLLKRAARVRVGREAIDQSAGIRAEMYRTARSRLSYHQDSQAKGVEVTQVLQASDRTFYRRGELWVDARVLRAGWSGSPDRVVDTGSADYRRLVQRFVQEGRPGLLSVRGSVVFEVDGEAVLVPRWRPADARAGSGASSS